MLGPDAGGFPRGFTNSFRLLLRRPYLLDTRAGRGFEAAAGSLSEGQSGRFAGTLQDAVFMRLTTNHTVCILTGWCPMPSRYYADRHTLGNGNSRGDIFLRGQDTGYS